MLDDSYWRLPLLPLEDDAFTGGGDQARAAGVHTEGSMNDGVMIAEELLGCMPSREVEVATDAVPQQAPEAQVGGMIGVMRSIC